MWHHTLTTFSHELAQARLDWRHAYIMMSCARIYTPISLHLKSTTSRTLLPATPPSCTLLPLLPLCSSLILPQKRGSKTSYYTTKGHKLRIETLCLTTAGDIKWFFYSHGLTFDLCRFTFAFNNWTARQAHSGSLQASNVSFPRVWKWCWQIMSITA